MGLVGVSSSLPAGFARPADSVLVAHWPRIARIGQAYETNRKSNGRNTPESDHNRQPDCPLDRAVFLCLHGFACVAVVLFLGPQRDKGVLWREVLLSVAQIVVCIWYWKLAQLFRLYERGLIFAAEAIRCIKVLGLLCAIRWIVGLVLHFAYLQYAPAGIHPMSASPQGAPVTVTVTHFEIGFFSFDFGTGIDFGLLLTGAVIVLAAWIMEEGRKIQEEQALTV